MGEWKEYKLGDFVEINKKSLSKDFAFDQIEYLDTGSITRGNIEVYQKLKIEEAPSRAKRLVEKNDVIYSTVRPIQRHYGLLKNPKPNTVVSTGFVVISIHKQLADPYFIYYFLTQDEIVNYLDSVAEGSTSAYPSLTPDVITDMDITAPDLPEQKSITSILSSLDDKIDLLHRQNKTLEALAETLFRQWFVEEADESWEVGKLGDILDTIESGSRPKGGIDPELKEGIPSIGAENINGLGFYDYSNTKWITKEFFNSMKRGIIKSYDVLIYKDGAYVGRKGMFANGFPFETCTVNEHVFILRSNSKANQIFLYFLLEQEELAQLNANSAQPGLNQGSMKSFEIVIPPFDKIKEFEAVTKSWINKILFNCNQIRTLTQLRDTLLPKLMSGEVRVKD